MWRLQCRPCLSRDMLPVRIHLYEVQQGVKAWKQHVVVPCHHMLGQSLRTFMRSADVLLGTTLVPCCKDHLINTCIHKDVFIDHADHGVSQIHVQFSACCNMRCSSIPVSSQALTHCRVKGTSQRCMSGWEDQQYLQCRQGTVCIADTYSSDEGSTWSRTSHAQKPLIGDQACLAGPSEPDLSMIRKRSKDWGHMQPKCNLTLYGTWAVLRFNFVATACTMGSCISKGAFLLNMEALSGDPRGEYPVIWILLALHHCSIASFLK